MIKPSKLAAAISLTILAATPARADSVAIDTKIANECVKAFEAHGTSKGNTPRAIRHRRNYTHRVPLCRCIGRRVSADDRVSAQIKGVIAEYYAFIATKPDTWKEPDKTKDKQLSKRLGGMGLVVMFTHQTKCIQALPK